MSLRLLACIAVLGIGTAAAAEDPPQRPQRDPNRMICQTDPEIGSLVSRVKVCHTAAEWAEIKREARQNLERSQGAPH